MSVGKKWLITLTGFAAAMVVASPSAVAGVTPPTLAPMKAPSSKAIAGKYIVVLKSDKNIKGDLHADSTSSSDPAKKYGIKVDRQFQHAVHGFSASLSQEQLTKVRQDPNVAYVEADQVIAASPIQAKATEPTYEIDAWNLDRIDQRSLPGDYKYNYTADGSFVNAYIIDSGIWASHPDFGGRVRAGYTSISDGNGTNDCDGHGTHVAGTVGSKTYGVAKNVGLVPVRVLDCNGNGSVATVMAGVDWVTANHSAWAVANMSLGGAVSQALDDSVKRSIDSGVTYSVAAGNEDADACQSSPADVPDALTVAATDDADNRSVWDPTPGAGDASNWGTCVDLFAPGTDVPSTFNPNLYSDAPYYYVYLSGTSMATPHVTGAAALFLQKNLQATPAEVRAGIMGAATQNAVKDVKGSPNAFLYTTDVQKTNTPTRGPSEADRLKSGEALIRNDPTKNTITSPDGRFTLTLQPQDGNLVLYEYGKRPLWASGIKTSAAWLLNQPDGNVVDNNSSGTYAGWATNTGGGKSTLVLQNDGNVVLYRDSDHKVLWAAGTCCHGAPPPNPSPTIKNTIGVGQSIHLGQKLTSPNGIYTLVLQDFDGNLVLYKNGTKALWAFGPRWDSWFTVQTDGNMVAYKSEGGAVWASNTQNKGQGTLTLQDDGNLVLYRNSDHGVIWATNTYGK
ncbi:S8 family serine peptidase [Dactylosporangium sp. CA-139066]|uniref:S8 family serine peptidase n=1 Tax=Dactylosporangium sp. CA-139066 TaxID=3239930 RepID=UPI003D91F703